MLSVYNDKRPTICFLCLGDEAFPTDDRVFPFHTSDDLTKHFKRKHLKQIRDDQKPECNVCRITLEYKMHLQHHAHSIHGTVS
jgi:hypothetical protein